MTADDTTPTPTSTTSGGSTVGIVTDSNSQLTADLAERFDVEVVPMTVTVDGIDHLEGVDLDADGFYGFFDGRPPEVSTSQPSPGSFAIAYRRLVDRGCTEIWSIHIAEAMSGTVASAQLGAGEVDVPVHVIDTGSASFGVGACVWAAGVVRDRGGDVDDVRRRIESFVGRLGTTFMVGVPLLVERGGRAGDLEIPGEAISVLAMNDGDVRVLEQVSTVEDTIDVMSTYAASWVEREPGGVTVAIGTADEPSRPLSDRLAAALTDVPGIDDVVHYRVGPSVGAHTGPGTFGLFVFPTIR
ncbi:DegV family protein with EDD domain [Ilumatobacter fluminis]|uniref:DegV family protein with EDD domain n=1 Tax=Ilumatobacter fluminis TaxID=467091 RepID=A0A4R7I6T6_9ACTN|nr:DegV family protein [Ilumatobacter fluminis]TDT18586.1 DegV family protein with EDD domain [Ilumatobacter fluminis]